MNPIRCLHFCLEEKLYHCMLIAIGSDLSEFVITFMHGGMKSVGISASHGHRVRAK